MLNDIKIRRIEIDDKETLKEIYKLRVICRQDEGYITFDKFPDGWFDETDLKANHFVVYDSKKIIAAARCIINDNLFEDIYYPAYKHIHNIPLNYRYVHLSRVVVLPKFRNKGISKELVLTREVFGKQRGSHFSILEVTSIHTNNFLKLGYTNLGLIDTTKIKWDLNQEHYLMYKEL